MEQAGFLIIGGMLFLSVILMIFLHELGHALLASHFSKKEVKVFLGSYGNLEDSISFKIGRLHFYIIKNIFKWRGGLCVNQGGMSFYQNMFHILAGTFFPLIAGIILLLVSREYSNGYIYYFSVVFLILSTFSLITNLYPKKKAIIRKNGSYNPNDGYLLKQLFRYKKNYHEYITAIDTYNEKKYSEAALQFKALIDLGLTDDMIIRLCLSSAAMSKNFDLIKEIIDKYENQDEFDIHDFINIGYFYSNTDRHDKALKYYKKALKINKNWLVLNNIGYSLTAKGDYSEAITYLDQAIALNSHAYGYNNRGLAKIKLGLVSEGLEDLEHGLTLDPNNSYYYKNMGIYHSDRNEYQKALEFFEKAKEMDSTTYKIDEDIEATKIKLQAIDSII